MEKRIIILLLCLLVQGCVSSSTFKIKPEILTDQIKVDKGGFDTVVSQKKISVYVRPGAATYTQDDSPEIVVGVICVKEINFSPDDIKAFVDGKPHHILTHEESIEAIKEQYYAAAKAIKDKYEGNSKQAEDKSMKNADDPAFFEPSSARRGTVENSNYGGVRLDAKTMQEGKDTAETLAKIDRDTLNKQTKEKLTTLLSTELKETTVPPDEWYQGQIKIAKIPNTGKPHVIKLVVTVEGEEHQFLLKTQVVK